MRICVVIMAGGRGERLWPKSTHKRPKQFLRVFGERTLLQQTLKRSLNIAGIGDVYVVNSREYSGIVREQLPELPRENLIVEPDSRGTAATIGYAASYLKERMSEVIMVVLPSDHVVSDDRKSVEAVQTAVHGAVAYDGLMTLGIKPTRPETSYGYIECGEDGKTHLGLDDSHRVIRVEKFTEKPSLDVATRFIETGRYLWNSGMFVWRTSAILDAIARYAPELGQALGRIAKLGFQSASTMGNSMIDAADCSGSREAVAEIRRIYDGLDFQSIDYAVMEKADSVFVVPSDFQWDDVGNWMAMERIRELDDFQNVISRHVAALDSHGNIIENHSLDKVIVACGVNNLIIVNADDAILIMDKSQCDNIRKIRRAVMDINHDTADN